MGLKTGLFTSPHLVDFRERICVNGLMIEERFIIDFWKRVKNLVLERKATFFDTTTALAFDYFRAAGVDVAVIETGLGGRLDSTNIVNPDIAVITPINLDHEKQLGNSLKEISAEKAGIIKKGCAVFSADQHKSALISLRKKLSSSNRFFYLSDCISYSFKRLSLDSTIFDLDDKLNNVKYENLKCRQIGDFQVQNIALAYLVSRAYLQERQISFSDAAFKNAIASSIWSGRLQCIQKNPNIFFDVSHNAEGIKRTVNFLRSFVKQNELTLLIGMVKDKNYQTIANFLTRQAKLIVITEPDTHRKLDGTLLVEAFRKNNQKTIFIKDLFKAFDLCKDKINPNETLLVIGSHYLIGALSGSLN
jgi:dihydrofolate synthase/folylpolyglutamate synthase